jgi:hypothetical protein
VQVEIWAKTTCPRYGPGTARNEAHRVTSAPGDAPKCEPGNRAVSARG